MIRITREWAWADIIRSYKIYIDGVYRGDIYKEETKEFVVDNGRHTVCAKLDRWCRSNELCVDVNDSIVELEVGNSMTGGWKFLLLNLYVTIWRHKYLWLKERESVGEPQGESDSSMTDK